MSIESKDVAEKAGLIESLLTNLEAETTTDDAMDIFREIFEHWGFDREDYEIERDDLDEFVDENTGELRIISIAHSTLNFYVIYAETWKDTLKYRQKLVKNLLKFTSYSSDISFANFILVLDVKENPKSQKHKYWKLIIPIYQRKLESAKLNVYVIDPEEKKFRTLAANMAKVALELSKHDTLSASLIKDALNRYMLIRPLTEEFFREYKKNYYELKNWIKERYGHKLRALCPEDYLLTGESTEIPKAKREEIFVERAAKTFAHTLFNRLMFVYFLQKKGWIVDLSTLRKDLKDEVDVKNFVRWLHDQYEEYGGNFYRDYLRTLFLYAMNRPRKGYSRRNIEEIKAIPSPVVRDVFIYGVPYFNGGLFSPVEMAGVNLDEVITEIDDKLMTEIVMGFFEAYNFTVTEETPYEVEVAVDPAMLGKIYESLIAEEEQVESEEERRASGIFYTPRSEVDFMCRMAVYEYLERNTKLDKDVLMKFVFTPSYEWNPKDLSWEQIDALEKALNDVKVVDPAAGSGAFLVGMYHLLIELHEKLTEDSVVTYKKKLEIIRDNIYGVDIKDWAIRVAKLRLWLALIEGEGKLPNEPILPNLETKLAVGDSLAPPHFVLKIGGKKKVVEIPLAKFRESLKLLWAKKGASEAIVAYKELVKKYYLGERIDGKSVTLKDIERAKWGALQEFLERALEEELKAKEKKEVKLLLEAVKNEDFSALEKPPFIWELDFPDVMLEKRGFDIVIANPPYVRQEKIYPEYYDLAEFQMLPKKEQEKLKKDYKNKIKAHMETILKEKFLYPGDPSLPGRSDLYAYFFIQSVNLLNPNGSLVFITSNSWLDVDFGKALQEFFIRATYLKAVIDYTKRSFEQADVNTVITVLTRKPSKLFNLIDEKSFTNFVLLKVGFEGVDRRLVSKILEPHFDQKGIEVFGGIVHSYEDDDVRVRSVKTVELAKMGGFKIQPFLVGTYTLQGEYKGMKWGGILIRAPRIFYVILDKGRGKLVKLGEIAEIKYGIKTGINDFFYVEPIKDPVKFPKCSICGKTHEDDPLLVPVKNPRGWEGYIEKEFLVPVLKSPREIKKLAVEPSTLSTRLFLCPKSKEELKLEGKVHALSYIEWGEKQTSKGHQGKQAKGVPFPQISSVQGRRYWYDASNSIKYFDFVCNRFFNDRFFFAYFTERIPIDQTFYGAVVKGREKNPDDFLFQIALLNSTVEVLIASFFGRTGLGEGVLQYALYEMEDLISLNATEMKLSPSQKHIVIQAFEQMANRPIKSIFEELGLPKPNRDLSNINPEDVSLDKVLPDRRELDRVIFEALGLTEEEQLEVYKAVVELVKARLVKAKTFSKKKGKR
ncbi:hypothetical protein A3K92_01985 [Thermococcus gorgonarius]|uniref:site-specific DNA-methyltransferase (adenine-specific) n=2 Tax=Thermococcus gorgonarius TaxID=71997 RepID=A0A2Z2M7H1_THEGO|nr:hypothetical protein A3K92_01985 [Thermococcus gorgonarius]